MTAGGGNVNLQQFKTRSFTCSRSEVPLTKKQRGPHLFFFFPSVLFASIVDLSTPLFSLKREGAGGFFLCEIESVTELEPGFYFLRASGLSGGTQRPLNAGSKWRRMSVSAGKWDRGRAAQSRQERSEGRGKEKEKIKWTRCDFFFFFTKDSGRSAPQLPSRF